LDALGDLGVLYNWILNTDLSYFSIIPYLSKALKEYIPKDSDSKLKLCPPQKTSLVLDIIGAKKISSRVELKEKIKAGWSGKF
jgi:hypothetical protein